ncbi:MAG: bifunctional demethylmenaquinone methyltransferase/2-methoxy-6-polyprenyl-1,4-benzoquinol methylase UbiE [Coriobacteriia bacterium]|nr:bifunctional demethylmenaquinone methyltransferase/2-methoxy-6-polyprenyl-1,4-benzoquinol methylase UbiE [Coriobacteriia bacterium]
MTASGRGSEPGSDNVSSGLTNTDRVRGIFARIAPGYDSFNALASMGIDRLWRRAVVRMAGLTPESRVLDLAAGTGDLTIAMARQAGPASILSTDFVPEMLAVGEHKGAAYKGPTRLAFQVEDAQALTLPEATFDVVTVAFGVRNFPDRAANFREVLRVLVPGGRYVILEFSRPPFAPWRALYHFYLRTMIPLIGGLVAGDRDSFVYLNDSIRQFPAQEPLAAELRDAGFSNVTWRDMTGGIVAVHVAVK